MITMQNMQQLAEFLWEIPQHCRFDMRVPARVYATKEMLEAALIDGSIEQLVNMATLPGIYKYAVAMPDIHFGYGFPIGGVAAMATEDGVISPGGVGYGQKKDLEAVEENGSFQAADASLVSEYAKKRGFNQAGTLGSGNHFGEIQLVEKVYDTEIATAFGLFENQITVMLHSGSRGLGHQVCTDYVKLIQKEKYDFTLPDAHLACAPFKSDLGQQYFKAMAAAANFAWVNRQLMTYQVRKAWYTVLKTQPHDMQIVYDVAHNIAKLETYDDKELIVHRKGAARAFGPEHPELPKAYQKTGQPVLIPGSMGTGSYVLSGLATSDATFGSACHGAGRRLSRSKAKKTLDYQSVMDELAAKDILVRGSHKGIVEEAPKAYKDIENVVDIIDHAQIAKKIVKLKPLATIKG